MTGQQSFFFFPIWQSNVYLKHVENRWGSSHSQAEANMSIACKYYTVSRENSKLAISNTCNSRLTAGHCTQRDSPLCGFYLAKSWRHMSQCSFTASFYSLYFELQMLPFCTRCQLKAVSESQTYQQTAIGASLINNRTLTCLLRF